jgi:hypothetical protein
MQKTLVRTIQTLRLRPLHPAAILLTCLFTSFVMPSQNAWGQITTPRTLSASVDPFATLEEQLINRLRATSLEQRSFLRFVVRQVREGRLQARLVVGIERYALRRKPSFPFPFFERALRFEAAKVGVALPSVRQFATTRQTPPTGP